MSMLIHCPGCRVSLKVPTNTSGRRARCPVCHKTFIVPAVDDLFEETVSVWLHQSGEAEERRRNVREELRIACAVYHVAQTVSHRPKVAMAVSSSQTSAGQDDAQTPNLSNQSNLQGRDQVRLDDAWTDEDFSLLPDLSDSQITVQDDDGSSMGTIPPAPPPKRPSPTTDLPGAQGKSRPAPTQSRAPLPEDQQSRSNAPAAAPPAGTNGESEPGNAPGAASPTTPPSPPKDQAAKPLPVANPAVESAEADYPRDPSGGQRPYLLVMDVNQTGVTLSFLSTWLEHPRFRFSLPIACIFTGKSDEISLSARPLAFVDRSQAQIRSPREIESRFEVPLREDQGPAQVVEIMGRIDDLPTPFCLPMPYYLSPAHQRESLNLSTTRTPEGELLCLVQIPNHRYALQWLAAVNGTCGVEYALLSRKVAMLENDAWKSLPDSVRQRLCAWCEFHENEQFCCYAADADFGARERGLAGIILSNQRLVYHKFHHRGEVPLTAHATLHIRRRAGLSTILVEFEGRRSRCGNFRNDEITDLLAGVDQHPTIQVMIVDEPG